MDYRQLAYQAAVRHGIDPNLFLAQINQESRFNPQARSHAGAMGLAQLMPGTASDLGVSDPWDPYQNLDGGARYMAQQLKTFGGDPRLALAAYNAGPGNVNKHGGIPPFRETQNYVRTIMAGMGDTSLLGGEQGDTLVAGAGTQPGSAPRAPLPPIQGAPGRETFNVPGLLGNILGMGQQQLPPGPEETPVHEPDWLERKTKGWLTEDRRDRLAIGLEGMTLRPNQAWQQSLQGEIKGRKDDKAALLERQRTDAETLRVAQNEQLGRNQTAEWLKAQGREDLAGAMLSGALPPGDAIKIAMTPAEDTRPDQVQAYEYARQQGSQLTFDEFVGAGADDTALIQNYEYAKQNGYEGTFDEFLKASSGASKPGYMGTIPEGHQLVEGVDANGQPTMRMEPIPGSPSEIEVTTLRDKEDKSAATSGIGADRALQNIARIREMTTNGNLPVTGFFGPLTSRIPGTEPNDVRKMIDTLSSNMAFDRLQRMRDESPTGGALGAVSEKELQLLKDNVASLSQSQSQEQFLHNLNQIEQEYMRLLQIASSYPNAAKYGFTGASQPLPTASPNTNDPGRNNNIGWRIVE